MAKRVYISGRITGLPKWYVPIRFRHAERKLKRAGYIPVSPSGLNIPEELELTWDDFMKIDYVLLKKCDAIYMLSNWKSSKGAKIEKQWAESLSMEIMYEKGE